MKKIKFHSFTAVRAYLGVSLFVLLIDQISKRLIEADIIRISHIYNEGAVMGMFKGLDPSIRIPFFFVSTVLAIVIILFYLFTLPLDEKWNLLGLALIMGGAFGNFVDRIVFGKVLDFIETGFWPVFNLADTAISTGVTILLFKTVFPGKRNKESDSGEENLKEKKNVK